MAIDMSNFVSQAYLADLTDDDLMHRPHPDCNHINWQVGHLILSEHQLVESVMPGCMPPLPEGFVDRYGKAAASCDDPASFDRKDTLLELMALQRQGTLAALARCSQDQLAQPAPEHVRSYAPTIGDVFSMQGGHWMMHAGQWAVARRQLGRPPLF
jgi:hypothetical protein